ncbi:MAG: DNA-processing protein DprA [Porphyromonas sp.]|nr:DNA-processing protein DprA [Porphyromonas sp.]
MSCKDLDRLYEEREGEFEKLLDRAGQLLDKQEALGIQTLSWQDKLYPHGLKAIGQDAPPLIHLLGDSDLLNEPQAVAIIGARAADSAGLDAAYRLGQRYAEQDEVVVSGLALGCDAAAHEGCLSVLGKTIAIVASGLDITHPKEHVGLQSRILESGGLLLSEQLIRVKANPTRLIARNRLQAALSQAVILAQCPRESGSMKTMGFARKYKKKCFAVAFSQSSVKNGGNRLLIEESKAAPIIL